jgi:3'-5' exoribonuclease
MGGRKSVREIGPQESVDQIFLASGKQLRPNRAGNLYLQMDLSDATGTINARLWNANEDVYRSFENGDFVRVAGTTQVFQGAVQLIANSVAKVSPDVVDSKDFLPLNAQEIEKLRANLEAVLQGLQQPFLKSLAEAFLADRDFMDKFCRAPAGIKHHHAYQGGLLEHVVQLLDVAGKICDCYDCLDRDLLLMGVFLHDVGKIEELSFERELAYTDEGQLLGHLVEGISILDGKLKALSCGSAPPPGNLGVQLKHMIISHHGDYEFGSPKLPMTLEAVALHLIDNLDAKLHAFQKLIAADANVDSAWTVFHPHLGRKLYKSSGASLSGDTTSDNPAGL